MQRLWKRSEHRPTDLYFSYNLGPNFLNLGGDVDISGLVRFYSQISLHQISIQQAVWIATLRRRIFDSVFQCPRLLSILVRGPSLKLTQKNQFVKRSWNRLSNFCRATVNFQRGSRFFNQAIEKLRAWCVAAYLALLGFGANFIYSFFFISRDSISRDFFQQS